MEMTIRVLEIIILIGAAIVISAFAIFILCLVVSFIVDKIREVLEDGHDDSR